MKLIIVLLLILAGCKERAKVAMGSAEVAMGSAEAGGAVTPVGKFIEEIKPCPEEANLAALNKIHPLLGYIDKTSIASLDNADKTIACLRPWAETLAG